MLEGNEIEWEQGPYVGVSSATIFAVMMGRPPQGIGRDWLGTIPEDPGDFARCHRLLQIKPEWRGQLTEVAARHPEWGPFVENWDYLTELFERKDIGMYAFMKTLKREDKG